MLFNDKLRLDLTPMRVLALYLSAYVDSWEHLVLLHTKVVSELPTTLDSSELLIAAKPKMMVLLEKSEKEATASQDVLMHTVIRNALIDFRQQLLPNIDSAKAILDRLPMLNETSKQIIEAYYVLNLRGQAVSEKTQLSPAKIAIELFLARHVLSSSQYELPIMDGSGLFPSLVEDFIQGQLDKDSIGLLQSTISNDVTKVAEIERQWRAHVILLATFSSLPFQSEKQKGNGSSFKEKGTNKPVSKLRPEPLPIQRKRGNVISSVANRAPTKQASSPVKWFVMAGGLVIAVVLAVMLSSGNKSSVESKMSQVNNKDSGVVKEKSTATTLVEKAALPPTDTEKEPISNVEKEPSGKVDLAITQNNKQNNNVDKVTESVKSNGKNEVGDNILSLISLPENIINGAWSFDANGALVARGETEDRYIRIQLPYVPAAEYDLLMKIESKVVNIGLGCVVTCNGKQALATVGEVIDGVTGFFSEKNSNETTPIAESPIIEMGKIHKIEVRVRANKMELLFDDKMMTTWDPSKGALAMNEKWILNSDKALGLGITKGECIIHSLFIRNKIESDQSPGTEIAQVERVATEPNGSQNKTVSAITQFDYLKIRDGFYADISQGRLAFAESYFQKLLNDPFFADVKDHIQIDLALVILQKKNIEAEAKGARLLLDGRKFVLEEVSGKRHEVIRAGANEIQSVTDVAIIIESKMGDGRVTQELPLKNLKPRTRATLAKMGLLNAKNAELLAVINEVFVHKSGQDIVPDYQIKEWLQKSRGANEYQAAVAYLEGYFNAVFSGRNIADQMEKIEKRIGKADKKELESMSKSLNEMEKTLNGTMAQIHLQDRHKAIVALVGERMANLKTNESAAVVTTEPAPGAPNAPTPTTPEPELAFGEVVYEWTFKDGLGQWSKNLNIANLKSDGADMIGEVRNADAHIIGGGMNILLDEVAGIEVVMRADRDSPTEIYYATATSNGFQKIGEARLKGPGYQTLRFDVSKATFFKGVLKSIRIDPINGSNNTNGKFAIRSISLRKKLVPK